MIDATFVDFLKTNWYWAALASVSGIWLLIDTFLSQNDKTQLSPVQATLMINHQNARIIDVRNRGEFEKGHIPNARNIPVSELPQHNNELEKLSDTPLIVYCASGVQSKGVIGTLHKNGLKQLYNLRGGLTEWERANLPVTRGKKDKDKPKEKRK